MSEHSVPQSERNEEGHVQVPRKQVVTAGHTFPQRPQFCSSDPVVTQESVSAQYVWPDGHWHEPLRHSSTLLQTFPQEPQLLRSVSVLEQVPVPAQYV
jgi:hypothetical protein